ncbi:15636_t:CDS:2, partial [Funneliformis mosseae]
PIRDVATSSNFKNNSIYTVQNDGIKLEALLLDNNKWSVLQDLLNLLKPFAQITDIISGSQYPILSMIYPVLIKLKNHLINFKTHANQVALIIIQTSDCIE